MATFKNACGTVGQSPFTRQTAGKFLLKRSSTAFDSISPSLSPLDRQFQIPGELQRAQGHNDRLEFVGGWTFGKFSDLGFRLILRDIGYILHRSFDVKKDPGMLCFPVSE